MAVWPHRGGHDFEGHVFYTALSGLHFFYVLANLGKTDIANKRYVEIVRFEDNFRQF